MLHKIGITKCNKKNLIFFNNFSISRKINFLKDCSKLNNIVSFMVSHEILEVNISDCIDNNDSVYINNQSFVNIFFKLNYKIIYSYEGSNNLQIFYDESYHTTLVKVPSYIDGNSLKQMLKFKKLKINFYIENIDTTLLDDSSILVTPYILVDIDYFKGHTLAYILKQNSLQNSIFISLEDGSNLVQKTFDLNTTYFNLTWTLFGNELAYLTDTTKLQSIFINNISSKKVKEINLSSDIKTIDSFCFIDNENIIVSAKRFNAFELYKLNSRTNKFDVFLNCIEDISHVKPKFSITSAKLFFIAKREDADYLCCIDTNGYSIRYICNCSNILDYSVSYTGEYAVLLTKVDENTKKAILVKTSDGSKKKLNLFDGPISIKNVEFSRRSNIVALIVNDKDYDDVYVYNVVSNKLNNITRNKPNTMISSLTFNSLGTTIYYSSNESGFFNVYSYNINSSKRDRILNCSCTDIYCTYKSL